MEQAMNQDATANMMIGGAEKKNTGLIAGMIVCAILAIGGIGFGTWGMMESNNKSSEISDLKVQVADKDGAITTLETEKIETTKEDGTTITIADTPSAKYVFSDNNASELNKNVSMTVASVTYTGIRFNLHLDGSVDANYQWVNWDSYNPEIKNQRRQEDTLTSYIDGHVVDISTGHIGNGSFGEVFFLLDNGTVAYAQEDDILSKNFTVRKLAGADSIVRIYGNLSNMDYAGFIQKSSGKISPIVLDSFDGTDAVLRVE